MGGGGTETSTVKTGSSNPMVEKTQSKLLGKLNTAVDQGVNSYPQSLYPGVGGTTRDTWNLGVGNARSLLGSGGFNGQQQGAMGTMAQLGAGGGFNGQQQGAMRGLGGLGDDYAGLSGAFDQDAPGYQRMRQGLMDDAVTNVGSGFTSSGRFGGGSYIDKATESAVDAVAPLDYQNFQNDVNNRYRSLDSQQGLYGTLFGMGQQGVQNRFDSAGSLFGMGQQGVANRQGALGQLGAVGAAQDADALARRQGENDLFRRQNDRQWDALGRASSILAGTAGSGGQTQTNTQPATPWWQTVLGAGAMGAGIYGGFRK